MKNIKLKPGDYFNKTKIIESVKALEATGKFIPGKTTPTPIPVEEKSIDDFAVVNLEFEVIEK